MPFNTLTKVLLSLYVLCTGAVGGGVLERDGQVTGQRVRRVSGQEGSHRPHVDTLKLELYWLQDIISHISIVY